MAGSVAGPSTPILSEKFSLWPVAIALAIGVIVFFVIADRIHQRETVMRGQEIDRRVAALPGMIELPGRAGQPVGQFGNLAAIAAPEAADTVTILVVPFQKWRRNAPS